MMNEQQKPLVNDIKQFLQGLLSKLDSTNLLAEIESQIVETDKKIRELQNQQNPSKIKYLV